MGDEFFCILHCTMLVLIVFSVTTIEVYSIIGFQGSLSNKDISEIKSGRSEIMALSTMLSIGY